MDPAQVEAIMQPSCSMPLLSKILTVARLRAVGGTSKLPNWHGSEEGSLTRLLSSVLGPLWASMPIWRRVSDFAEEPFQKMNKFGAMLVESRRGICTSSQSYDSKEPRMPDHLRWECSPNVLGAQPRGVLLHLDRHGRVEHRPNLPRPELGAQTSLQGLGPIS